jgi:hypothetical protein
VLWHRQSRSKPVVAGVLVPAADRHRGLDGNNAANPVSVDDVWILRADHGAGAGTWTGDQSATGLVVNGNDVEANGLAVEHFEQYETIWNGQGGTDLFFQNENPYEVPSQSAWMSSTTQDGYPIPSSTWASASRTPWPSRRPIPRA